MPSKLKWIEISVLLFCIVMAASCHKRTPAAGVPTAAPVAAAQPPTPGPPTCSLTAIPATVTSGQSVTLDWTSKDATKVSLNAGLGAQEAEGSTSVTPSDSTTYTMSATGPGGTGECSARVTVTPAVPPTPSVSESNIPPGNPNGAALANALQDVYFDFAKSDIRGDGETALTHDANYLKSHPDIKIQIGGYCDQRGSEEYNLGLGERRAESAKRFLVNLGVAADRLNTISFGKDRPFCTEPSEDCYQQNRRDHLTLVQQQ
ncbi:MAG TPA: OmpA family protein [Terriglobia bacterium]|nr:OmpA family protein [Terriglobia bacterium]